MITSVASRAIPSEASNILLAKKAVHSKARGSDMEAYSAYPAGLSGTSERTGDDFDFTCRSDLLFHTIFYPENARRFDDCLGMWREVNRVETHCKAQFAFELVLPLSPDLPLHHNIAMLEEFATWYRVRHGVPVQCDIHSGVRDADAGHPAGLRDNPHAHLLMPTRTLGPDGFGAKTRHLNPPFFRGLVMEEEGLRHAWADSQRRYCERHDILMRIEPTGFVPQPRLGPPARWKGRPNVLATLELVRKANVEAACDPVQVLAKLTENNASFTDSDLEWLLRKHLGEEVNAEEQIAVARTDVLEHADLILLYDKASGDWSGRYSTHSVREQEEWGIRNLVALADLNSREAHALSVGEWFNTNLGSGAASVDSVHRSLARHPLLVNEPDQRAAFDYTVAPGLVKVIKGRAGTGKSYTLSAIREAFEQADATGKPSARVIGLSHMHVVKEDMKADGFREVYTVHHMLNMLNTTNGTCWRDVAMVAIDEAAMLSTGQLAGTLATDDKPEMTGLLEWARRTGTKLVLVGDDRQLPSIERGGLFTEIATRLEQLDDERHSDQFHAREITKVRRQRDPADRTMSEHLAQYDFDEAVRILDTPRTTPSGAVKPGCIDWCADKDQARNALVDAWARDITSFQDGAPDPVESRFVFAFTHHEVDELNQRLCEIHLASRRERHGDTITQVPLTVCYKQPAWGEQPELRADVPFAVGDRIQFTGTNEQAKIFNGNLATITAMEPVMGHKGEPAWALKALVDVGGRKKEVCWRSDDFRFIRHGYAGTGWKGQGKTIDTTYHLFSSHWDAALSYMLLTRFRDNNRLFVASPDGEPDRAWLASQMKRRRVTEAAIAWDAKSFPASAAETQHMLQDEPGTLAQHALAEPAVASAVLPSPPPVSATLIVGRDRFHQRVRQYQERRDRTSHKAPRALFEQWDKHLAACRQSMLNEADDGNRESRQHRDQLLATAQAIMARVPSTTTSGGESSSNTDLTRRPELRLVLREADTGKAVDELIADLRQQQHPPTPSDNQQNLDPRDRSTRNRPRSR